MPKAARRSKHQATPLIKPAPVPQFIATQEQQVIGQHFLKGENLCINAFAGTGKALRNDQPVMTPFGYKPISELSVNDLVIGSDGNAYPVTGVYPQGVRSLYDIEFSDKTHVIADADHRWKVYRSDHRLRDGGDKFLIKTTSELAEKTRTMAGSKAKSRDGTRSYWFMPMTKPVNFFINNESLFDGLPIDPWLFGVLLGDGGISGKSVTFSTADDQILFAVRDIIAQIGMITNKAGKYDYRLTCIHKTIPGHRGLFNPLSKALDQLKIRGLRSHEKFIPPSYIFSSVEDRLAVLQGLFDTDGSVSGSAVEYTTTSKQMANEVQFIVHSLGGTATISEKPTRCKLSYRLYIKLPAQFIPFRLKRKFQSMKPAQHPPFRAIRSITPVEPAEATCISVGSPDHIFLTNGCIPTHNTATLVYLAHLGDGPGEMWCFNKRNADEAVERFPKDKTRCTTGHSRAYRAMEMGQHPKRSTLNETWPNWRIVREFAVEGVSDISKEQVAYAAMKGLHRYFYSADPDITLRHCWDSDYPLEWFERHLNNEHAKTHPYDASESTQRWQATQLPKLADAWHQAYIRAVHGYAQQFLDAIWDVGHPFPMQHDAYFKAWQLRQPVLTDVKYLMQDECFPAGTYVETDSGSVLIEIIAANPSKRWRVLSSQDGGKTLIYSPVTAAYKTPTQNPLFRILHDSGEFVCTANHPVWVQDSGWKAAGTLQVGDTLSGVWNPKVEGIQNLLPEMRIGMAGRQHDTGSGTAAPGENQSADEGGANRDTQSSEANRCSGENISDSQESWEHFQDSRRQRAWADPVRTDALSGTHSVAARWAMEPRCCRVEWTAHTSRIAYLLQDRHCFAPTENSYRSGWGFASESKRANPGCEENRCTHGSRVVGVEMCEPDRPGGCNSSGVAPVFVYTLSVESGAYFAGGVLVKNCQDSNACMMDIINRQKCQIVIVGDPQQAIYGFRGAVDAMKDFPARVCYLTQNYRSGIEIVDVGNAILQGAYPGLPMMKGHPQIESSIGPVDRTQPYAVLSRTNAALFEGAISATHCQQPMHVIGKLKDAIHRAESVYGVYIDDRDKVTHPEIRPFEDWNTVLQEAKYNADLFRYVQLTKDYDKELPVICEKLKKAGEVPIEKAQVILSTAHRCVHPDTLVETPNGLVPIKEISDQGKIATPDGVKMYVDKFTQEESETFIVTTKKGYHIEVTANHGMTAWDGTQQVRINAEHLCIGDLLRLRVGLVINSTVYPTLPKYSGEIDKRAIIYPVPAVMNEDFGEFLGLMVADGTVYHKGFRVVKSHMDVNERFKFLVKKLFNYDANYCENLGTPGYDVSSVYLSKWLKLFVGVCPKNKSIPIEILYSPMTVQSAFLRGLFEDGTVNLKKGNVDHIHFETKYQSIAETVQVMLLRFGIISTLKDREVNGFQIFTIYIYGNNLKTFYRSIGFVSSWKNSRLATQKSVSRSNDWVPITLQELESIRPFITNADHYNIKIVLRISRYKADEILAKIDHDLCGAFLAERIMWHYDPIVSIKKSRSKTICITVPEGSRFIQNGFDGWNSKGLQHDQVVIADDSTRIQVETDEDGNTHFIGPNEEWNLKYIQVTRAVHRLELDPITHAVTGERYR